MKYPGTPWLAGLAPGIGVYLTVCLIAPVLVAQIQFTPRTGFVTLQFDDSHDYHYTHIFPILEEHGFKGSFGYITETSALGIEHDAWKMQEISQAGHEIQDHTTRHNYRWTTHIDTVDDGTVEWIEYTFADLAEWDSLCRRSMFILDSLGMTATGWNQPGGSRYPGSIPGHPEWIWTSAVNDSFYDLLASRYLYVLGNEGVLPHSAHLNLRGHNYPDRFPLFNPPHVTIDHRTLSNVKTGIADAVASGLWYMAVSHAQDLPEVTKIEGLAQWLAECNIEVLTTCEGCERIHYGHPDPLENQFPQARMLKDLDENGIPDGFTGSCSWDTTSVPPVDSANCLRVYGDIDFCCYGPEAGVNAFSIWARSVSAPEVAFSVVYGKMGFYWEMLGSKSSGVQCSTEWSRIDSSTSSNFLLTIEEEVDRVGFRINGLAPGDTIILAYPEFLLMAEAGTDENGTGIGDLPNLVIRPNPVVVGTPLLIDITGTVSLYDVRGRHILSTGPISDQRVVSLLTTGLKPGVYLVRDPTRRYRPAKVVVCE